MVSGRTKCLTGITAAKEWNQPQACTSKIAYNEHLPWGTYPGDICTQVKQTLVKKQTYSYNLFIFYLYSGDTYPGPRGVFLMKVPLWLFPSLEIIELFSKLEIEQNNLPFGAPRLH